jgi:DNA-binding IclR family transcriptional regulator
MTNKTEFTELETQVLDALIGGLDAEPGFSNIDANDLAESTDIPTKQIRGVLSSLVKKGVVTLDETDTYGAPKYVIVYLNESYWHLHPEWKSEIN